MTFDPNHVKQQFHREMQENNIKVTAVGASYMRGYCIGLITSYSFWEESQFVNSVLSALFEETFGYSLSLLF